MEYIIQILILFILLGCALKISFWQWWQAVIWGIICMVYVVATCQWSVLQSKTQLADFLNNLGIMQDVAVLITIESMLCFAYCFCEIRDTFSVKKGKWWKSLLRWYPGLLIFPALFYLQTQLVFSMPGVSFNLLSCSFSIAVLLILTLLSRLVKWLCPEKESRLEIYFLVNLFVCIIGLITTVNGNTTYATVQEPLNIKALATSLGLLATFFVSGILLNKIKWKIKNNRNGNHL